MLPKFPDNFLWGTAISAFQTEMGNSEQSICSNLDWYEWANNEKIKSEKLVSGDRPQDGDDFWDLYENDLKLAKSLGNNAIRFSIEWGRIFKDETFSVPGEFRRDERGEPLDFIPASNTLEKLKQIADMDAVDHYLNMIKSANKNGLKVALTLYHWPIPLWLHDPIRAHMNLDNAERRGWIDGSTIEEFAKYSYFASLIFRNLPELWETINEPEVIALNGYLFGDTSGFPPGLSSVPLAFQVERNLAFAHNLAYRTLKKNTDRPVGIGTSPPYFEPAGEDRRDAEMADTARYMNNEWILNAIVNGEFDNGLTGKPDEKIANFGGSDYIGIDYYSRMRVRYSEKSTYASVLPLEFLPCINCSDFQWDIYPLGMREVLKWIYRKYGRPMYILENGIADSKDEKREEYIISHIKALHDSIYEDRLDVRGYFHWSLIDNYEWSSGFSKRFGLYEVDYVTKERKRRKSAEAYERICKGMDI
jgi:beta-galactosidase